jgi:hypothetical protein
VPPSALSELAKLMRAKHDEGDPPYVLFVGTAASLSSGCSAFSDVVKDIAGSDDPADLFDLLDRRPHGDRAALLGKHLRGCSPSSGYRHLAELVKAGYFDVILTTNVDSLLETALLDAGLRPGRDYVCMVNGRDRDEEITRLIKQRKPRVKILKLHGDLELGILVITPAETFQFSPQVSNVLREHLNRSVLIVGYGPWDSHDVTRCLELSRQSMWYVAPDRPARESFIYQALVARRATRNVIFGEEGRFDRFFEALRAEWLSLPTLAQEVGHRASPLQQEKRTPEKGILEPVHLRLDVAVPDQVELDRVFDLAAAVLQPSSPVLTEDDLTRVHSGDVQTSWSESKPYVHLRVRVSAPECEIHGSNGYPFRLYLGQDSPVFYFHLTPQKLGEIGITVTVYQEDDMLGSARVRTVVREQVVGHVQIEITSHSSEPEPHPVSTPSTKQKRLVRLRKILIERFGEGELRTLCFDLGVDYDDLPGDGRADKVRELIIHLERRCRIPELVVVGKQLRPDVSWTETPSDSN